MSARYQQKPNDDSAPIAWGVVLVGLAISVWFCWYKWHSNIATAVIQVHYYELNLIARFTDKYGPLISQVHSIGPENITFNQLYQLCHLVGLWFRIPAVLTVAGLGIVCAILAPAAQYRRNLDLDKLIKAQASVFPVISSYAKPREVTPSLHVEEWIKRYASSRTGFDEGSARRELKLQLGPKWQGYPVAESHVRCLFAAFALHAYRDRTGAIDLLGMLAQDVGEYSKISDNAISKCDDLLKDPDMTKDCIEITSKHAYTMPAMMSLLCYARRRSGVLAPAQFNFLRLIDRRLWYALHSLGFPDEYSQDYGPMPNPLIEAAGVRAHWHAELMAGKSLYIPQLEEAASAIRAKA